MDFGVGINIFLVISQGHIEICLISNYFIKRLAQILGNPPRGLLFTWPDLAIGHSENIAK